MNSGQQHRREREQKRREHAAPVLQMTDERYMELLDAALERRNCIMINHFVDRIIAHLEKKSPSKSLKE